MPHTDVGRSEDLLAELLELRDRILGRCRGDRCRRVLLRRRGLLLVLLLVLLGPLVRLPTHQSNHYWRNCKADYRPAGLGFSRAGFAPAGRQIEFHEIIA